MVRGSLTGFLVGVLPGAGGTIASFLAYSVEERIAGSTGRFGRGDPRGVAGPESANNAAANGALIPLLTLGVPGSGTTAVLLGALLGLGVTPGPLLLEQEPDLFWGLRGGGGNFGIVTAFEYQLHPVGTDFLSGSMMFPLAKAREVLDFYAGWMQQAPKRM